MPLFTVVSPYTVKIDAGNLHDAMKSFAKQYYHHKINEFIVKDYTRHYKANLKYSSMGGRRRIGININPWMGPVVPGPIISQNVLHYTPPIVTRVVKESDDDKVELKPKTTETKDKEDKEDKEEVTRRFYAVSPVASPMLPSVPIAGPLGAFNQRLVARPIAGMAMPLAGSMTGMPMAGMPMSPTYSMGSITPPMLFGGSI